MNTVLNENLCTRETGGIDMKRRFRILLFDRTIERIGVLTAIGLLALSHLPQVPNTAFTRGTSVFFALVLLFMARWARNWRRKAERRREQNLHDYFLSLPEETRQEIAREDGF